MQTGKEMQESQANCTESAQDDEHPAEEVLRSLASWLSAGGYNAPTVDPKVFHEKIRWGVDNAIKEACFFATKDLREAARKLDVAIAALPEGLEGHLESLDEPLADLRQIIYG